MAILRINGQNFHVDEGDAPRLKQTIKVDGMDVHVELLKELSSNPYEFIIRAAGRIFRVGVVRDQGESYLVRLNCKPLRVSLESSIGFPFAQASTIFHEGPVSVTSPMAGRIVSLKVEIGSVVEEGQGLFVLNAMKMENEVATPRKGRVTEIYVTVGTLVKTGQKLALID